MNEVIDELTTILSIVENDEQVILDNAVETAEISNKLQELKNLKQLISNERRTYQEVLRLLTHLDSVIGQAIEVASDELERIKNV
ncbi:MAG: hypothetical protein D8H99_15995 [Streptococcus sp.]|nr:MAG: hypothetical protein D8H99_15995 [Streptococcus sp.]